MNCASLRAESDRLPPPMFFLALLLKPFLYAGALAAGWAIFRPYGRHWGSSTVIELLVIVAAGALFRLGAGIVLFLALALALNAAYDPLSDAAILRIPAFLVLGTMGLALWAITSGLGFRRAPWWKRIAFACAAEAISLVLDWGMMTSSGDGGVMHLSDLLLSGRGLGGC